MPYRYATTLLIALAAQQTFAADAPPAAPPAQWDRAIPAKVLIGAEVGVGTDAQLMPSPLLLRIDEPRRLHDAGNKAAECVLDAEANGNLAAERVNVRLTALRCFDAEGGTVISKRVQGYVVDADARAGTKATVAWSQAAKDLAMIGAGAQARQNILMRGAQTAASRATLGLSDGLFSHDEDKAPPAEVGRELRSADTLLPVLNVEPGHALRVVILGGAQ